MKVRYATILGNPKKPETRGLKSEVSQLLKSLKVKTVSASRAMSGKPLSGHILITIGGDGTILYNKNRIFLPVFAIGSESSFICQAIGSNWRKKLSQLITHGSRIEKRTMLSANLEGKPLPDALNEFVIRSREHRVIRLHLQCGGRSCSFRSDGLIFSTATGSHAYAYSAGGKEMPNLSKNYQVVPICPYRREFSPVMLKSGTVCKLKIEPSCRADAVSDGQFLFPIKRPCTLEVRVSKRKFLFARQK
jgi:NAD+ kinase